MTVIKVAIRPISGNTYHCQLRYSEIDRRTVPDISRLTRVAQADFSQLEEKDIEVEIIENLNGPSFVGIGFDVMFDIEIPPGYMQVIK